MQEADGAESNNYAPVMKLHVIYHQRRCLYRYACPVSNNVQ